MKQIITYILLVFFTTFLFLSCNSQNGNNTNIVRSNTVSVNNNNDSLILLFNKTLKEETDNIENYYKTEKKCNKQSEKLAEVEKKIEKLKKQTESLKKQKKILSEEKKTSDKEFQNVTSKYKASITKLNKSSLNFSGELHFFYKGKGYFGFIADPRIHKVETYLKDYTKKPHYPNFSSLANLYKYLKKNGKDVLMLTNAGMFTPEHKPEGLFIFKGKEVYPVDNGKQAYANFYMKPNGVFYMDGLGASVVTTKEFNLKYPKKIKPYFATQSGPMLVINGKLHPKFNYGSPNLNIRSGVGILPNGNIIFIISNKSETNFFDFATIFKDIFACKNALFLDGAISKMYLKNLNPKELGGNFGPLISVTKK